MVKKRKKDLEDSTGTLKPAVAHDEAGIRIARMRRLNATEHAQLSPR